MRDVYPAIIEALNPSQAYLTPGSYRVPATHVSLCEFDQETTKKPKKPKEQGRKGREPYPSGQLVPRKNRPQGFKLWPILQRLDRT